MGSGHFLVEAVDFVSDEILRFLSAFPWNPVFAHLQYLRRTILEEMEKQDVTVDPERLTDTNLLKRHVLKRCIFGVDVNPMAVELAKVSLWLDCFTLGAPLSFLEHHLRTGNSLVGSTMEEVDELRNSAGQLTLARSADWRGLLAAVKLMVTVGGMPDTTPAQLEESRTLFQKALPRLSNFKRILNVHTAKWFFEEPSILDQILRSGDLFEWAVGEDAPSLQGKPYGPALDEVLRTATRIRFFHWQLEFPEVFYTENSEPGFDAVVGNPPYIRVQQLQHSQPEVMRYLVQRYESTVGNFDIYLAFLERGLALANGEVCFIVSNKWFSTDYGRGLRGEVLKARGLRRVVDFKDHQLFEGVTTYPAIVGISPTANREFYYADASAGMIGDPIAVPMDSLLAQEGTWSFGSTEEMRLMGELLNANQTPLGQFLDRAFQGVRTSDNQTYVLSGAGKDGEGVLRLLSSATGEHHEIEAGLVKRLLSGDDIRAFSLSHNDQWVLFPYRLSPNGAELYSGRELQARFPKGWKYLQRCEKRLRRREGGLFDKDDWWQFGRGQNLNQFQQPKVMMPDYHHSPAAAFDERGDFYSITAYCLTLNKISRLGLQELTALLNSDLWFWLLGRLGTALRGGAVRFMPQYLKRLPVPDLDEESLARLRSLAVRGAANGFDSMRAELNEEVAELYELSVSERLIIAAESR